MRSIKFLKNMRVTFIFYIINIILSFVSRSIFINKLGTDLAGINSLLISLIGFLNVAELGIATAVGYSLYKPLSQNNFTKINEIMILFKYYYINIAKIILTLSIFMSIFIPFMIKSQMSMYQVYAYYAIYVINCVVSYLFTYKHTLIIADQNQYKISTILNSTKIIKVIVQSIALYIVPNYIIWLKLEILFNLIGMLISNRVIDNQYIYVTYKTNKSISNIKDENIEINNNIKNAFFHKIGGFVVFQTDSIVISIMSTLKDVAIYSNYIMIINSITGLIGNVIGSIMPSIGNLIAEDTDDKSYRIFKKLYLADHILALFLTIVTYKVINKFIIIWIGEEYLFSNIILVVLMINLYIQLSRGSKDRFKDGFGIYWDTKAPIFESIVNLVFSIILSYNMGIIGVFIGTIISNILIVEIWKPYMIFKYGFRKKIRLYMEQTNKIYIKNLLILVMSNYIYEVTHIYINTKYQLINLIGCFCLISTIVVLLIILFYRNEKEFKDLFKSVSNIIGKKLKRVIVNS